MAQIINSQITRRFRLAATRIISPRVVYLARIQTPPIRVVACLADPAIQARAAFLVVPTIPTRLAPVLIQVRVHISRVFQTTSKVGWKFTLFFLLELFPEDNISSENRSNIYL